MEFRKGGALFLDDCITEGSLPRIFKQGLTITSSIELGTPLFQHNQIDMLLRMGRHLISLKTQLNTDSTQTDSNIYMNGSFHFEMPRTLKNSSIDRVPVFSLSSRLLKQIA
jgi:hypothetical protein